MSGTTEPAGRTRRRRRPAAASRILVTGLSISTALGLVAGIDDGSRPAATVPQVTAGISAGAAVPAAGRRSGRRPEPVTRSHASR